MLTLNVKYFDFRFNFQVVTSNVKGLDSRLGLDLEAKILVRLWKMVEGFVGFQHKIVWAWKVALVAPERMIIILKSK